MKIEFFFSHEYNISITYSDIIVLVLTPNIIAISK